MFSIESLAIRGCRRLIPPSTEDPRGRFVKVFRAQTFRDLGLETDLAESFYSISKRGVLRGLHYQMPPDDHAKLVHCMQGRVIDVLLDLRPSSETFGTHECVELDAERPHVVYIPRGIAHGFLVTAESATLLYQTTREHKPESDVGIRWDSAGIEWPSGLAPIVSERDRSLPTWEEYAKAPLFA